MPLDLSNCTYDTFCRAMDRAYACQESYYNNRPRIEFATKAGLVASVAAAIFVSFSLGAIGLVATVAIRFIARKLNRQNWNAYLEFVDAYIPLQKKKYISNPDRSAREIRVIEIDGGYYSMVRKENGRGYELEDRSKEIWAFENRALS